LPMPDDSVSYVSGCDFGRISRNRGIRTGLRYPHGFANLLPKPGACRAIG
jgi:hypothetical protein